MVQTPVPVKCSYWHVATVDPPVDMNINGKYVYQGWRPCMDWCRENFGGTASTNLNVGRGWRYISEGVFEFEREQDLTAFLLRWG